MPENEKIKLPENEDSLRALRKRATKAWNRARLSGESQIFIFNKRAFKIEPLAMEPFDFEEVPNEWIKTNKINGGKILES